MNKSFIAWLLNQDKRSLPLLIIFSLSIKGTRLFAMHEYMADLRLPTHI